MRKLLFLFMLFLLASCATTKQNKYGKFHIEYQDRYVHDTVKERDSVRTTDSVYIKDSVFIKQVGDTVYQYTTKIQYRYKTLYKDKSQSKSLSKGDSICKRDSTYEVKTVTEYVNKLNWLQSILMYLGILFIVLIVVYLLQKYIKYPK